MSDTKEICVCGDRRDQHAGGSGACILNGLGHGGAPSCLKFRPVGSLESSPPPVKPDREMIERLKCLLVEEDRIHPIGCSAWKEEARYISEWAAEQLAHGPIHPDREAVARIIDPETASAVDALATSDLNAAYWQENWAVALIKADAILALLPTPSPGEGKVRALAEAEKEALSALEIERAYAAKSNKDGLGMRWEPSDKLIESLRAALKGVSR